MNVTLAEPGSAVFENVSEDVHTGIVIERLPNMKATVQGNGLVEATINGEKQKLPFTHGDLSDRLLVPRVSDEVTFQVATNIKRERAAEQAGRPGLGQRATKVTIVGKEGTVVAMKGKFGFIEYEKDAPAIPVPIPIVQPPPTANSESSAKEGEKKPDVSAKVEEGTATDGDSAAKSVEGAGEDGDPVNADPAKTDSDKDQGEDVKADQTPPPPAPAPTKPMETADKPPLGGRKLLPSTVLSRIFFHVSEVIDGLELVSGDVVQFVEALNPRTKELNARRVKRIKEAPPKMRSVPKVQEERPDHLKFARHGSGTTSSGTTMMRLAKGPDGTNGFSREYQVSRGKVFDDKAEDVQLSATAAPFLPAKLQTP